MTPVAFVAGATGYTGRELVRALRARGIRTIAHVRPDSPRLEEWRARFSDFGAEVDATPWDRAALSATFRRLEPTHIFSLLGTTQARMRRARSAGQKAADLGYEAVDYGLTALLIDAAVDAGQKPRFIYLSAMGVSSSAPGGYYQARYRAEEKLKASGLPWIIARPALISGPDREERRPLERFASQALDGALSTLAYFGATRLEARYRTMTGLELAQALVKAAFDPELANRVLEPEGLRE